MRLAGTRTCSNSSRSDPVRPPAPRTPPRSPRRPRLRGPAPHPLHDRAEVVELVQPAVHLHHQLGRGLVVDRRDAGQDARGPHRHQRRGQAEQLAGADGHHDPESQADSTIRCGARPSCSRSCTVRGPSAISSAENIGLSARNLPWAATCTSPAPSMACRHRPTVADPSSGPRRRGARPTRAAPRRHRWPAPVR